MACADNHVLPGMSIRKGQKIFSVDQEGQADLKVFKVKFESQDDLKIFFVDYASQAGWRNRKKMHLLF